MKDINIGDNKAFKIDLIESTDKKQISLLIKETKDYFLFEIPDSDYYEIRHNDLKITEDSKNTEIERKFLIKDVFLPIMDECQIKQIKQCYICENDNFIFRIRITENNIKKEAFLTIKSKNKDIARKEFEYDINLNDANKIYEKSDIYLTKERKILDFRGYIFEFDDYKTKGIDNVVEVEFNNLTEAYNFSQEDFLFLGKDCSDDNSYSNYEIAKLFSIMHQKKDKKKMKP